MKKSIRLALMAGACFLGLAFAAPAFSAYGPSLIMEQSSYKLGAPHGRRVHRDHRERRPTAKLTIFSPVGYNANLTRRPARRSATSSRA